ncbi:OmpA family protein [uncultured Ferrimonas sp.]|uniref:OmpA family protein n=1 Tax=uncultured Ferrimonas sp. TaxID=432640 RepID=UPI00262D59DC|nr:OmpA family protein [uncultured Ferrimonas sp.]
MKAAIALAALLCGGCTSWPQEGHGGYADQSLPWDGYLQSPAHLAEHQALRSRVVAAQQTLELLRLRGAMDCLPERTYQADQLLTLVRQELADGLIADAHEHQLLLDNHLFRLTTRLTALQQQTGCSWGLSAQAQPLSEQQLLTLLLQAEQFALDRAELLPLFQQRLQLLAQYLAEHPGLLLTITGYTDTEGTAEYNQQLGQLRAEAVAAQLTRYGVPDAQLQLRSEGAALQLNHADAKTAALASRRIEFRLSTVAMAPTEPVPLQQWRSRLWGKQ